MKKTLTHSLGRDQLVSLVLIPWLGMMIAAMVKWIRDIYLVPVSIPSPAAHSWRSAFAKCGHLVGSNICQIEDQDQVGLVLRVAHRSKVYDKGRRKRRKRTRSPNY